MTARLGLSKATVVAVSEKSPPAPFRPRLKRGAIWRDFSAGENNISRLRCDLFVAHLRGAFVATPPAAQYIP
jgi:hypothetical protein